MNQIRTMLVIRRKDKRPFGRIDNIKMGVGWLKRGACWTAERLLVCLAENQRNMICADNASVCSSDSGTAIQQMVKQHQGSAPASDFWKNQNVISEMSCSHGDEYDDNSLLVYCAVCSRRRWPTFQQYLFPSSSGRSDISNPAAYSAGPRFKTRPGDWLF